MKVGRHTYWRLEKEVMEDASIWYFWLIWREEILKKLSAIRGVCRISARWVYDYEKKKCMLNIHLIDLTFRFLI